MIYSDSRKPSSHIKIHHRNIYEHRRVNLGTDLYDNTAAGLKERGDALSNQTRVTYRTAGVMSSSCWQTAIKKNQVSRLSTGKFSFGLPAFWCLQKQHKEIWITSWVAPGATDSQESSSTV